MRPTDAIVTGFTKNAELYRRAFAPLQELKQRGVLRSIRYVTWDSAEIDGFVAPLDGVDIVRVPQPQAEGNGSRRGFVYQTRNLDAALAQVKDDALVVKLRPDFIFRTAFLEDKLRGFERLCATRAGRESLRHKLPRTPFARKIWIPWARRQPTLFLRGCRVHRHEKRSEEIDRARSRQGRSDIGATHAELARACASLRLRIPAALSDLQALCRGVCGLRE